MPCQVHTNGYFVLDGHRQQRWWVDLKIRKRGRNCSRDMDLVPLLLQFEGNLLVLGCLSSELDFKIDIDARRCSIRFRQASAYRDQREFGAARDLNHVEVAVAVSRIKRFDWYRDQEFALPSMANALALSCMTHALALMERMRYVICESTFLKQPLAVDCCKGRQSREYEDGQYSLIHKRCSEFY